MLSGRKRQGTGANPKLRAAARTLHTMRDLVRYGVSRFRAAGLAFGHGSDNAVDEALYLVSHALDLPLEHSALFLDARLTAPEIDATLALLERRVTERCPAAYLTGEAWIGPHRFAVDARVIVPRSFIGHWLCGDLAPWIQAPERIGHVLELCTGSGCLAILVALALPQARVTASDISVDALAVAQRNVDSYGLTDRIALVRSDLFSNLNGERYELILANPPYVTAAAMQALPQEYRHEPDIALAGGDDGLDCGRRILADATSYLAPNGLLIMEVGHARERVEASFPRLPFTWLEIDAVDDAVLLLSRAQLSAHQVSQRPRSASPRVRRPRPD